MRRQIAALQQARGKHFDVVISGDGGWKHEGVDEGAEDIVTFAWLAGFADGSYVSHAQRLCVDGPANNYDGETPSALVADVRKWLSFFYTRD